MESLPGRPPHTATVGVGPTVVNKVWTSLPSGNEGGLQPLLLGNTSLEDSLPPLYPPVKRTMVSSLAGGASVARPGCFCVMMLIIS